MVRQVSLLTRPLLYHHSAPPHLQINPKLFSISVHCRAAATPTVDSKA